MLLEGKNKMSEVFEFPFFPATKIENSQILESILLLKILTAAVS